MNPSPQVVVVGSCMIDLISYAPRLPQSGETLHGKKFAKGFGGKGCNQCVAARKLGADSLLVARVGADSFGHEYRDYINHLGIGVKHVTITDGSSSGMAQIIVADNGENQIVIVAGANNKLTASDVEAGEEAVTQSRVLLTQLEVPLETNIHALRLKAAAKKGIAIFNAAPAQANLPNELFSLPDIFCVNETEATLLVGSPVSSVDEAKQAVGKLQDRGCQHVIITLGELGVVYGHSNRSCHVIPGNPAKVVDTTGAGDAFLGALAFFLAQYENPRNADLLDCIKKANVVAALSVERPGTQTSFPSLHEIPEHLLE